MILGSLPDRTGIEDDQIRLPDVPGLLKTHIRQHPCECFSVTNIRLAAVCMDKKTFSPAQIKYLSRHFKQVSVKVPDPVSVDFH